MGESYENCSTFADRSAYPQYHISLIIRWSFSFQNNPKNLDLSKTELDLWNLFGRKNLVLVIYSKIS